MWEGQGGRERERKKGRLNEKGACYESKGTVGSGCCNLARGFSSGGEGLRSDGVVARKGKEWIKKGIGHEERAGCVDGERGVERYASGGGGVSGDGWDRRKKEKGREG